MVAGALGIYLCLVLVLEVLGWRRKKGKKKSGGLENGDNLYFSGSNPAGARGLWAGRAGAGASGSALAAGTGIETRGA